MDRARRHDHRTRAHRYGVLADASLDAGGGSTRDRQAPHIAVRHDARAARGGILEICDQCRLLRAAPASHPAVAARIVLRAAPHVTRQQSMMPPQSLQAPDEHLVAPRRSGVVGVDADAQGDGIE